MRGDLPASPSTTTCNCDCPELSRHQMPARISSESTAEARMNTTQNTQNRVSNIFNCIISERKSCNLVALLRKRRQVYSTRGEVSRLKSVCSWHSARVSLDTRVTVTGTKVRTEAGVGSTLRSRENFKRVVKQHS